MCVSAFLQNFYFSSDIIIVILLHHVTVHYGTDMICSIRHLQYLYQLRFAGQLADCSKIEVRCNRRHSLRAVYIDLVACSDWTPLNV